MLSKRNSGGGEESVKYQSNPHLDTSTTSLGYWGYNGPSSRTMAKPHLSTFSHHKSGIDIRYKDSGYKDDPNPYKVSDINEMKIQVQDPFRSKSNGRSMNYLNQPNYNSFGHSIALYSTDDDDHVPSSAVDLVRRFSGGSAKYEQPINTFYSPHNNDENEYEIPVPDYEGVSCSNSNSSISDEILQTSTSGCVSSAGISSGLSDHNGSVGCGGYAMSINSTTTNNSSVLSSSIEHDGDNESDEIPSSSPSPTKIRISEEDRKKIEYSFLGRKTTIYVSDSLANLYSLVRTPIISPPRPGSTGSNASGESSSSSAGGVANKQEDWVLKYTGVPVLLLDAGETKNRDKRKIQIVLAELGTGLALFRDLIDNLTSYRVMEATKSFHTFHMSSDHTKIVGLSFDDEDSAQKFAQRVDKLTSDFSNISLSGSKGGKKWRKGQKSSKSGNKAKSKLEKYVRPKKSEISQPCAFQHVASLNSQDKGRFSSLQNFVSSLKSSSTSSKTNNITPISNINSPSPSIKSSNSSNITMGVGVLSLNENTELSF